MGRYRDRSKSEAIEASKLLLSPLIDVLLKVGVSAGDFSAISKTVYVQRASEHVRARSGRSTISRIAIVTGLTRAEVTKLIRSPNQHAATREYERHRAERVIEGWRTDPEFSRSPGRPLPLPLRGATASFASLVKKYSGDIPLRAMLDQLTATRLVARSRDGNIRLSRGRGAHSPIAPGGIRSLGEQAGRFLTTLSRNLEAPNTWYVGTVSGNFTDEQLLSLLRDRLARDGKHFLGTIADQLENPPQSGRQKTSSRPVRLGLTLFVHERPVLTKQDLRAARRKSKR